MVSAHTYSQEKNIMFVAFIKNILPKICVIKSFNTTCDHLSLKNCILPRFKNTRPYTKVCILNCGEEWIMSEAISYTTRFCFSHKYGVYTNEYYQSPHNSFLVFTWPGYYFAIIKSLTELYLFNNPIYSFKCVKKIKATQIQISLNNQMRIK